jgi:hypothetical protein
MSVAVRPTSDVGPVSSGFSIGGTSIIASSPKTITPATSSFGQLAQLRRDPGEGLALDVGRDAERVVEQEDRRVR